MNGISAQRNPNADIRRSQRKQRICLVFSSWGFTSFLLWFFFGFLASQDFNEIVSTNLGILFFQNWFFNANVIFIILERIFLHQSKEALVIHFGGFTPNMIVLHISIILGALLIFFVVKRYPEVFTPENLWGSVVIVLPFLVLKAVVAKLWKTPLVE